MRLLMDIGNTNLKFGFFNDKIFYFDFLNNVNIESKLKPLLLNKFNELKVNSDSLKTFIVSVNEPYYLKVRKILKEINLNPIKFKKSNFKDFNTVYETYENLGDDRIVTDYGAYKLYGNKLIVIDLGTAATFDLIDKDGVHLGGAIMPGKETYELSLNKKAKVLPNVRIPFKPNPIGRSTVKNLESGLYYGFIGSIIHMIDAIKSIDEYSDYKVILTGGDTELFSGNTKIDILNKELTLMGLNIIFDERIK